MSLKRYLTPMAKPYDLAIEEDFMQASPFNSHGNQKLEGFDEEDDFA